MVTEGFDDSVERKITAEKTALEIIRFHENMLGTYGTNDGNTRYFVCSRIISEYF